LVSALPEISDIHTIAFDFDGVFTDNKVWVDQDGREMVRCDRGDGLGFDFMRTYQRLGKIDIEMFIISKEKNPVVLSRAKKLQLKCYHGVSDKRDFVSKYLAERFPNKPDAYSGFMYMGNDINDLPLMRDAGFSVAPADSHPMIKKIASLVLDTNGGEGCVRDFIEMLLRINSLTDGEIDELISNC